MSEQAKRITAIFLMMPVLAILALSEAYFEYGTDAAQLLAQRELCPELWAASRRKGALEI